MLNKKSVKFILGFAVIVLIAGAGFFWRDIKTYKQTREAEKYLEEIEQEYREDAYGGKTPEETLRLFIDALKAGDIELASKYFVMEKREEKRNSLSQLSDEQIENMIHDLSIAELGDVDENRAVIEYTKKVSNGFIIINGGKTPVPSGNFLQTIILSKHPNNIWKIESL